jgi:diadenosine tetraphosphatase ApaH/serine/threonine PP2A family protein phosphatase
MEYKGTLFVNPGAVGRSLDGDPRLSYAILETKTLTVKHFREDYDLDNAVTAIQQSSMPTEIGALIQQAARRIDYVLTEA